MDTPSIKYDIAKIAFEKYVDPVINGIKKAAVGEWEKIKIDYDIAFTQYFEHSYEKYGRIKTILYRTEPKYIYDFFECPILYKKGKKPFKGDNVEDITDISHFVIINGTGGIGKSTFLKHLFINQITKEDLIPIFIELKDLNTMDEKYELEDFIFKKLFNLGSSLDKTYLEYALKSGCFLFLLDGYDEILTKKRDIFFSKFDAFCDRFPENYYIVSSRPYTEFVEFQRFTVLSMSPLSKKQAISLISKIEYDEDIKSNFIAALENKLYDQHRSFASNPLLLNIMLLTFDNYANIPEKLHIFYSNAFETLYSKHDATKSGYRREMQCELSYDLFKKAFSTFCFYTYYQGKLEFTHDELIEILGKVKKARSISMLMIFAQT